MVSYSDLVQGVGISKQTLYNWLKYPKTKPLITADRQQVSSKVRYNVTAIKAAIKKFPAFFGGGRDYAFRDKVTLTEAQQISKRFEHMDFMLLCREPVNDDDQVWYETEKQRRAEPVKYPGLDDSPIELR